MDKDTIIIAKYRTPHFINWILPEGGVINLPLFWQPLPELKHYERRH